MYMGEYIDRVARRAKRKLIKPINQPDYEQYKAKLIKDDPSLKDIL